MFGQNDLNNAEEFPILSRQEAEVARALIPAYSIGATDPNETRLVEALLASDPESAAALSEYQAMANRLLYGAPPTHVPPQLREKLLVSARTSKREKLNASPLLKRTEASGHLQGQRSWRPALLVSVLAIFLVLLTNVYWMTQITELRNSQQELTSELADHTDVLTLIGAGETRRVEMENGVLRAAILYDPEEPFGFLYVENFPPLSTRSAYTLWLLRDDVRTKVGTFSVNETGSGSLVFRVKEPVGDFTAVEITAEPLNNNTDAASPVLLSTPLSS